MDARDELTKLREQIDQADDRLIALLEERLKLVARASEVKAELGEATRSVEREAFLMKDRAQKALEHHLPAGLVEDILRRILRESYKEDRTMHFSCTNPSDRPIVLVGGGGGMGRLFERYFEASYYKVKILEQHDWRNAEQILKGALAVFICVPIDIALAVIEKTALYLDEDTILADITSVKTHTLNKMLSCHKGPVIGLHPMFGPDIRGMVKQVIVDTGGRDSQKCAFLLEQFKIWGARICQCSAKEHDESMGIIQAMRHFTTYCYGLFLAGQNPDLEKVLDLSSPIYHLELLMVGRLFAQDPKLYCDIIMASEHNEKLITGYLDCIAQQAEVIASHDRDEFMAKFLKVRDYFGEYADKFLQESGRILAGIQDGRSL